MAAPLPTNEAFNKEFYDEPLQDANINRKPRNVTVTKRRALVEGRKRKKAIRRGTETNNPVPATAAPANEPVNSSQSIASTAGVGSDKLQKLKLRSQAVRTATVSSGGFIWVWVWCQVPFALLTLLFLGLSYALRVGAGEVYQNTPEILEDFTEWLSSYGQAAITAVDALFMICFTVTWVTGMLQLFTMMFLFTMAGLRSISGTGATLKALTVLLCTVGYAVPGMNLFPWVGLYVLTVIWYPR